MKVLFHVTASGHRPVEEFIRQLPSRLQAAILLALEKIEEDGLGAPGVSFRQIRDKIWEIRINAAGAARIFYVVRRERTTLGEDKPAAEMILLHAYLKKTQKAPPREIEIAERRMKEVLG